MGAGHPKKAGEGSQTEAGNPVDKKVHRRTPEVPPRRADHPGKHGLLGTVELGFGALLSILGVMYENRSLVAMAETLRENDPGWTHRFASDLDCLDQYNYCACEVVVTSPIDDLDAMWEALETDRKALCLNGGEIVGHWGGYSGFRGFLPPQLVQR